MVHTIPFHPRNVVAIPKTPAFISKNEEQGISHEPKVMIVIFPLEDVPKKAVLACLLGMLLNYSSVLLA